MIGNDNIPTVENEELTLITPIEFAKYNTSIGKYSPQLVEELLIDSKKSSYLYSSLVDSNGAISSEHGILVSTPEKPSVLVESNASFCSIILTLDISGNAVLLHSSFAPPSDIDELEFSTFADDNVVAYYRYLRNNIEKSNNITLLCGHTTSTENNASLVKKALQKFFGQSYSNIHRYTEVSDFEHIGLRSASGIVFLPKQLTKINRNVVLFADKGIDVQELKGNNL